VQVVFIVYFVYEFYNYNNNRNARQSLKSWIRFWKYVMIPYFVNVYIPTFARSIVNQSSRRQLGTFQYEVCQRH